MGFAKDFIWGASSAAYQVEGAYDEDGKGPGIWDELSAGHVLHGENGNVACDQYHRYKADVALMKQMGLKAYRFSVSWPRVMPERGKVNEQGLRYYSDLVDELLSAGIEPICTLFHWNLPMWVHQAGGWHSSEVVDDFEDFVRVVADALSDRVKYWITINEPAGFIGSGYVTGAHAPFEKLLGKPMPEMLAEVKKLTLHALLAHGRAVSTIREVAKSTPSIGMALNGDIITPGTEDNEDDVEEARRRTFTEDGLFGSLGWWADPMVLGQAPKILQDAISDSDMALIHQPLDFFGYNCYNSGNYNEYMGPNPAVYPGMPRTAMGWPITKDALYWAARFITDRYHLPLMITENGMANIDFVSDDGKVHDPQRIEFTKWYLQGLQRAADEGYPIIGYCHWAFLDNFEWAEGYDRRFGLVYVDYRTQQRVRKDSSYWYEKVIENNGVDADR